MEQETDHHHSRHSAPLPHHSRHSAPPPTPPQQAQCTSTPSQQAQCTSTPSQQAQCTSSYPITTGTVHPYPITAGTVHLLLPHHNRHSAPLPHHSRHSAPLPHHSRHSAPPPTPSQQAQCTSTPSQQAQCTSTPSQQAQCTSSYPITAGTVHLLLPHHSRHSAPLPHHSRHSAPPPTPSQQAQCTSSYPITAGTVHLLPHHSRHKGHSHNQIGTNIPPTVIGTNVTHFIITVGTNVTPNTTSTNVTCSIIKTGTIVTPTDVSLCKTICRDYVPSKHKSHTSIIPIDTATTKIPTQLQLPSLELSLWPHLLISKRNRSATANLLSSAEFPSSASTSSGVGTYFRSYRGWGVTIVTYAMKDRKFKLGHSNNRDLSTTTLEECIITKAKQHLTTRDISACAE